MNARYVITEAIEGGYWIVPQDKLQELLAWERMEEPDGQTALRWWKLPPAYAIQISDRSEITFENPRKEVR
jgi:hypothetical protein